MKPATYKIYRSGTERTAMPNDTLDRVQPLMAAMGITRLANITGLDNIGIPVVMACRPNSRSVAVSQGKGADLPAAKASALMESVENHHAETITQALRLGSYAQLRQHYPLVDVSRLPASKMGRYHTHLPLLWIEARELFSDTSVWLPFETVSTDYTLPLPSGSGCFPSNSNGLASGNHLIEAANHGICEVIERDCITLWKLSDEQQQQQSVINLDTVENPICQQLLEKFQQAEMDVNVWETTSDVGVASFFCLIMGRGDDLADPEFGAGCHPNRDIALSRALTEAAQARTTYIAGSRDDFVPELYTSTARTQRMRLCRHLIDSHIPVRDFRQVPTWEAETLQEDQDWLLQRLNSIGIEQVAIVDLSKPEFNIPVVRAVIPGLEGPYQGEHSDYVPGARASALLKEVG